jgi:cardiolipin synthase
MHTSNLIATVMFVVFACHRLADGYLARKLNQTSSFGAFLDPVADKFLVCASAAGAGAPAPRRRVRRR